MNGGRLIRYGTTAAVAAIIGGLIGVFVRGGWTADWVGAVGTWVGSIATVAAILWAVHTFQVDRQQQRDEDEAARQEARAALVREAHRVSVTVTGGGGFGGGPWQMSSLNLRVINNTEHVVKLLGIMIEDQNDPALRLHPKQGRDKQLVPREEWSQLIDLNPPWPAHDNEMSGRPLRPGRRAVLTYRFDGRTWKCATDGEPVQVV